MQDLLHSVLFICLLPSLYAIKCWECQDIPPIIRDCSRLGSEGVKLSDCPERYDGCNMVVTRVYDTEIMIRFCGSSWCEPMMNIHLPKETFLSCNQCFEDGCNNATVTVPDDDPHYNPLNEQSIIQKPELLYQVLKTAKNK